MKFLILIVILSVLILPAQFVIPISLVSMTGYALLDSSLLTLFRRKSLYFLFTIVVIIQPLILGIPTNEILGVTYSAEGLLRGIAMFLRAIVIITSITYLNRRTKKEKVTEFWRRQGLEEFDTVLGKAQEFLPTIKSAFSESIKEARNETKRKTWFVNPAELLAKFVVPLLHRSNSIVSEKNIKEE